MIVQTLFLIRGIANMPFWKDLLFVIVCLTIYITVMVILFCNSPITEGHENCYNSINKEGNNG